MTPFLSNVAQFLKNEEGPTAVEYAVMLSLGQKASGTFDSVGQTIGGS